jgi:hypothetical protein
MLSILLIGALLDLGVSVAENPYNKENGLSVDEIVTIVKDAGWSDELIPEAVRVVLLESKGQPDKLQNDKGPAVGLFQIDLSVHWDENPEDNKMLKWFKNKGIKNRKEVVKWLQDPNNNAEAALQIWKDRDNFDESETGWEAWSVWNNGEIPEGREQKDWNIATKSMELALELLNNTEDVVEEDVVEEDVVEEDVVRERDPSLEDEEGVTLYNKYNQPVLVDKSIADDLVNNTDYTYESKETNPFKEGALINKFPDTNKKLSEFDEMLQKRVSDAAEAIGEDLSTISSMFELYLGTNYMQFFKKLLPLEWMEDVKEQIAKKTGLGDSPIPFRKPDLGPDPEPLVDTELLPMRNNTDRKKKLSDNFGKLFETMMGAEPR